MSQLVVRAPQVIEVVAKRQKLDWSQDLILWRPTKTRRGNIKCPKAFPKFQAKSFMFVVWSSLELMQELFDAMRGQQQEFYKVFKENFLGSLIQGEFSKTEKAHLQGCINFKSPVRSIALFKLFAPYLSVAFGLQLEKTQSRSDAWHYCGKPHNECKCEHCEKARLCIPNWTQSLLCGSAPIGRGKKFASFEKAMQKDPCKKNMIDNFGALYCRYHGGMEKILQHYVWKKACNNFRAGPIQLLDIFKLAVGVDIAYCQDPKTPRNIIWIFSTTLGTCKTLLASFVKEQIGLDKCIDGIKSYKHWLNAYSGESFTHFNFELKGPPKADDLKLLETIDDGGFRQGAMYGSDKKIIYCTVLVTSNHPPPSAWCQEGSQKRVSKVYCFDPPGVDPLPVWYNKSEWIEPYKPLGSDGLPN